MPPTSLPYSLPNLSPTEMLARARNFDSLMCSRRSCREFSPRPVPGELIEACVAVANRAPSGANRQPWRFVAVDDPDLKREIRLAAEEEERTNYERRMPAEWLEALEPLGTSWEKPFLEVAPWLVAVFRVDWEMVEGRCRKNYYPVESAGLACGFFLAACHQAGLATLTHTPSPMGFLRTILGRPENEKPYLLIPVGHPAENCRVPDLAKRPVSAVLTWNRAEDPAE